MQCTVGGSAIDIIAEYVEVTTTPSGRSPCTAPRRLTHQLAGQVQGHIRAENDIPEVRQTERAVTRTGAGNRD